MFCVNTVTAPSESRQPARPIIAPDSVVEMIWLRRDVDAQRAGGGVVECRWPRRRKPTTVLYMITYITIASTNAA